LLIAALSAANLFGLKLGIVQTLALSSIAGLMLHWGGFVV
jgi:hypothetical protein